MLFVKRTTLLCICVHTYLVRDILELLSSFEESFRRKEINVAQTDIYILALGLD